MSLTTHERRFGHPDPYRNLAAAMIWRAVADTRSEDRRLAHEARSWLWGPGGARWCDLLDVPRDLLLRRVDSLDCAWVDGPDEPD